MLRSVRSARDRGQAPWAKRLDGPRVVGLARSAASHISDQSRVQSGSAAPVGCQSSHFRRSRAAKAGDILHIRFVVPDAEPFTHSDSSPLMLEFVVVCRRQS